MKATLIRARLLMGLFLLLIGSLVMANLWADWTHTLQRENDRLSTQARVIRENMSQTLSAVNLVLIGLSQDSPLGEERPLYSRDLKMLSDAMPGIRTLMILDASGRSRYSSRAELLGRDFSQRDYFKAPFQRKDVGVLYISPPFRSVLGPLYPQCHPHHPRPSWRVCGGGDRNVRSGLFFAAA